MLKLKRYLQRHWSKNSICFELFETICNYIPNTNNLIFVDVFGWGWAMASNATYFFKKVIYNELDTWIYNELDTWVYKWFIWVQDDNIIKNLKEEYISKDMFIYIKNKENRSTIEELILTIWSFWNNRNAYIYWKNIEFRKYLTHKIIFSTTENEYINNIKLYNDNKVAHFEKYWAIWDCFLYDDDWDIFKNSNRRFYKFWSKWKRYRKFYKWFDLDKLIEHRWNMINKKDINLVNDIKEIYNSLESLESLLRLQSLERLERLLRLESLESLENIIEYNNLSYENLILPNPDECIIYLDPPYNWTKWYWDDFDYKKFNEYVINLKLKWYKIFLSEYNYNIWDIIREKTKRWFKSQKKDNFTWTEKLYFI